jgi:hypothetical protein
MRATPVTLSGRPLEPCYAPSMPAIKPTASPRSRAEDSACSELDTEEAGGVRRPSSEAWMDATWKRNTQHISTTSPTLFTSLLRRSPVNFRRDHPPTLTALRCVKGTQGCPGKWNDTSFPFMKKAPPLNEEPRQVPPPGGPVKIDAKFCAGFARRLRSQEDI